MHFLLNYSLSGLKHQIKYIDYVVGEGQLSLGV